MLQYMLPGNEVCLKLNSIFHSGDMIGISIFSSPLLSSCSMEKAKEFALETLVNAMNQKPNPRNESPM